MSKLGVHWMPGHNRNEDIALIAAIQPKSVKIIDPDVMQVHRVHQAARNALILLRDFKISEEHQRMAGDPVGTGRAHAEEWAEKIADLHDNARTQGLTMPPMDRLMVLGLNEPNLDAGDRSRMNYDTWLRITLELYDDLVDYTAAFMRRCAQLGLRAGLANLAVGWPPNLEDSKPPHWAPFEPLVTEINAGGHMLILHEYWPKEGADWGWEWYGGRYKQCPLQVPIIIGECGIDQKINGETDDHRRGWQAHMQPEKYMQQLAYYEARTLQDKRIHSLMPFTTDFTGHQWQSFNTWPIHDLWIHHARTNSGGEGDGVIDPPPPPTTTRMEVLVDCLVMSVPGGGGISGFAHGGLTVELLGTQQQQGALWRQIQIGGLSGWIAERNPSGVQQLRAL